MTILNDTERVTLVPPGTWELDPARSTVGFAIRHLKVTKVRGRFRETTGVIRCDREGVASIDGTVEVASIDTGDHRRDARLCAEDFSMSSSIRRSPSRLSPRPLAQVTPRLSAGR
jgi:polyisoprenoid-binding protein YceI